MKNILIAAMALAAFMPAIGSARVIVGFVPAYGYGYRTYWGPAPYYSAYPIARRPVTGNVKLDTPEKSANVFVDNAFVGTVADVKTLHLRQGTYDIRLSEPGHTSFHEKVFVSADHTLKLHPQLDPLPAGQ